TVYTFALKTTRSASCASAAAAATRIAPSRGMPAAARPAPVRPKNSRRLRRLFVIACSCPFVASKRRMRLPCPTTSRSLQACRFERNFRRKSHVLLRKTRHRRTRAGEVIQVRDLTVVVEGILIRKAMKRRRHPPREPLRFPDSPRTDFRISVQPFSAAIGEILLQRARKHQDVGRRQIEA